MTAFALWWLSGGWWIETIPCGLKSLTLESLTRGLPLFAGVLAVIDWELSTIGSPLADLAYCCQAYHWPADHWYAAGPAPA